MYHVLIVEAPFYEDISDQLFKGATHLLDAVGATYERVIVPGALEIPAAIRYAINKERYDGYVALGCVIRGETYHFEIVANESARGLQSLTRQFNAAIGNGILTVENEAQAIARADVAGRNLGGKAAMAAMRMIELKNQFILKAKPFV